MNAHNTLRLSPENQQILNSKYHKKLLELEWEETNVMHTQKVYCFLKAKCFPATAELPKHEFHNVFFLKKRNSAHFYNMQSIIYNGSKPNRLKGHFVSSSKFSL